MIVDEVYAECMVSMARLVVYIINSSSSDELDERETVLGQVRDPTLKHRRR